MDIKEILVLHHSHLDVGYTHTQPIVWELQREFIDHALEMLEETEDWPEGAAPKWTIEVTAQILKWLETAGSEKIEKLKCFISEGRIGISGLEFNTTPLCTAEQLIKQLEAAKKVRDLLSIEIKTANQHDVDGIPWTAVDILKDAGIELLIMAVNIHLGGPIKNRPSVFRWKGPSGREIFVMNGAHYTMFDQLLYTWEGSIDRMKEGLEVYLKHLQRMNYKHDFIYLTTAAAPVCWDNSPPSLHSAELIRKWNELGVEPSIRFITPNELLEKIKSVPVEQYEVRSGDWTDYWNFGAASSADVTKTNINAKQKLQKADMLNAFSKSPENYYRDLAEKTWNNINLFDEHTWGSFNSMDPDNIFSKAQFNIKDNSAYEANELAEYLLVDQLESFTENPKSCDTQNGFTIINLSGQKKKHYARVPDWWKLDGKRLRTARFGWELRYNQLKNAPLYGPFEMEPYSYRFIPFENLQEAKLDESLNYGEITSESSARRLNILETHVEKTAIKFIESKYYRLEFNPDNLRISSVYDKANRRELLDTESRYGFFQYVRERTDAMFKEDRRAFYSRELEKEQYDISCWKTDWKKVLETASKPLGYEIEKTPEGIAVIFSHEAPGVRNLKEKIFLHSVSPMISLSASFYKEEIRTPESVYFVFPLKIEEGWKCNFDTACMPTELDDEQLEGSSKDWFTAESYTALYNKTNGIVLYCPDAPMIQAGDFNFGKRNRNIERKENPLLLAWPMNNYWDTNFRPAQPGYIELEYHFSSFRNFDPAAIKKEADSLKLKTEVHPAMMLPEQLTGKFFEIDNENVNVLYVSRTEQDNEIIFRLVNYADKKVNVNLTLPGRKVTDAAITDLSGVTEEICAVTGNRIELSLDSRRVTTLKVNTSVTSKM